MQHVLFVERRAPQRNLNLKTNYVTHEECVYALTVPVGAFKRLSI